MWNRLKLTETVKKLPYSFANRPKEYRVILTKTLVETSIFAIRGNFSTAECGRVIGGNLQKIKCGTFRKLPPITHPHSAVEKFPLIAKMLVSNNGRLGKNNPVFFWFVCKRIRQFF